MLDYIIQRMSKISKTFPKCTLLYEWLSFRLKMVKMFPKSFVPKYFAIIVIAAYQAIKYRCLNFGRERIRLANDNPNISSFYDACLITTYQHYGSVFSSGLFPKNYPLGLSIIKSADMHPGWQIPCLAAGLPHFSTGFMRCWGRDIFIALPGLFLLPKHFDAARIHIIAFGSTLRHGLIPNLLDSGNKPRYNARDAVWFWMNAVSEYCRNSPEGLDFLGVFVARRFIPKARYKNGDDYGLGNEKDEPDADTFIPIDDERVYKYTNTIAQLCHEIFERHASGINFREYNAGPNLDHAMNDNGFNIDIKTLWDHGGTITGGNSDNCGTWMDKMGDSPKANTLGRPATPRDGAPIEIAGLLKSALNWVSKEVIENSPSHWHWKGVEAIKDTKKEFVSYKQWNELIQTSFEKYYFIPRGKLLFYRRCN
jgi:glycogen debranching enzyme